MRGGWAGGLHSAFRHHSWGSCGRRGEVEEPGLRRGGLEVGWEAKGIDCRAQNSAVKKETDLPCGLRAGKQSWREPGLCERRTE